MTNEHLIQQIKLVIDLPDEEAAKLTTITSEKFVAKGQLFIAPGQVPEKFAFVHKGLFRYYYPDTKGNEFTKSFFTDHSFISSYSAMINGVGSYYGIQALEDSHISVISYTHWSVLRTGHPCWNSLLIKMLEKGYIKKEAREREFLICDAEQRYKTFLHEYPHLDERIKQHLVASYLGITPVALSRIRKKMGLVNIG